MRIVLSFLLFTAFTVSAQTPRVSLYEEFTGETCPPCASTNPALNALLLSPLNQNRIIPIKWQVPIPFAPTATWSLYQTNKTEIDWRYGPSPSGYGYPSQSSSTSQIFNGISGAPQGVLDGQHQWVFGAASDHPANLNNNVITNAVAVPSSFSVNMVHEYNNTQTAVNVTINITATAGFTATGALVFRCVMVERVIQFSVQPGTNGEKMFEDVAIKSYPSIQAGTPMTSTWTIGQTQTIVLNCVIPSYIRSKDQISMVGFIQDDGTKKVAQAARSRALIDAATVLGSIAPVCTSMFAPVISFSNAGISTITSATVTTVIDGNQTSITNWTGNLQPGATTTLQLNSSATPTGFGSHNFTSSLSVMSGNDFYPQNNVLNTPFVVGLSSSTYPIVETFANTSFPPPMWAYVNINGGNGWSVSTDAGAYFIAPLSSARYSFFTNSVQGDIDELYLTPLNLEGTAVPELNFDYAYAQRNSNSNDKLEVMVSDNCGVTWNTIWSKSGSVLATASATLFSYVPDAAGDGEWQTAQLTLPGYNKQNVLAKFVTTNNNGNNLYLDNINFFQKSTVGIKLNENLTANVSVYPNPANESLTIIVRPSNYSGKLKLMNSLGQQVWISNTSAGEEKMEIKVKDLPEGIYTLSFENGLYKTTKKLTILH